MSEPNMTYLVCRNTEGRKIKSTSVMRLYDDWNPATHQLHRLKRFIDYMEACAKNGALYPYNEDRILEQYTACHRLSTSSMGINCFDMDREGQWSPHPKLWEESPDNGWTIIYMEYRDRNYMTETPAKVTFNIGFKHKAGGSLLSFKDFLTKDFSRYKDSYKMSVKEYMYGRRAVLDDEGHIVKVVVTPMELPEFDMVNSIDDSFNEKKLTTAIGLVQKHVTKHQKRRA